MIQMVAAIPSPEAVQAARSRTPRPVRDLRACQLPELDGKDGLAGTPSPEDHDGLHPFSLAQTRGPGETCGPRPQLTRAAPFSTRLVPRAQAVGGATGTGKEVTATLQERVLAAYRESGRRFPQGGARFVIFSVLFFAIELGVFLMSILVLAGAFELEGENDTGAGMTFLVVGVGLLGFYWWMLAYLTRSRDDA